VGEGAARAVLDVQILAAEIVERPVEVASGQCDNPFGRNIAGIRECRTLTGVVAPFEFSCGSGLFVPTSW